MYRFGALCLVLGVIVLLIPDIWVFGWAMMLTAIGAALLVPAYTVFATANQNEAPGAAAGYISMSLALGYGVASLLEFTSTLCPLYTVYLSILFST